MEAPWRQAVEAVRGTLASLGSDQNVLRDFHIGQLHQVLRTEAIVGAELGVLQSQLATFCTQEEAAALMQSAFTEAPVGEVKPPARRAQQDYSRLDSFIPEHVMLELEEPSLVSRDRLEILLRWLLKIWLHCPSEGTFAKVVAIVTWLEGGTVSTYRLHEVLCQAKEVWKTVAKCGRQTKVGEHLLALPLGVGQVPEEWEHLVRRESENSRVNFHAVACLTVVPLRRTNSSVALALPAPANLPAACNLPNIPLHSMMMGRMYAGGAYPFAPTQFVDNPGEGGLRNLVMFPQHSSGVPRDCSSMLALAGPSQGALPPPGNALPPPGNALPPPGNALPPPGNALPPPGDASPPAPAPPSVPEASADGSQSQGVKRRRVSGKTPASQVEAAEAEAFCVPVEMVRAASLSEDKSSEDKDAPSPELAEGLAAANETEGKGSSAKALAEAKAFVEPSGGKGEAAKPTGKTAKAVGKTGKAAEKKPNMAEKKAGTGTVEAMAASLKKQAAEAKAKSAMRRPAAAPRRPAASAAAAAAAGEVEPEVLASTDPLSQPKGKAKARAKPKAQDQAAKKAEARAKGAAVEEGGGSLAPQEGTQPQPLPLGGEPEGKLWANTLFDAQVYGRCRCEHYSQKSYIRRYNEDSKKWQQIVGSTHKRFHRHACKKLIPHVQAGTSREDLLKAREDYIAQLEAAE